MYLRRIPRRQRAKLFCNDCMLCFLFRLPILSDDFLFNIIHLRVKLIFYSPIKMIENSNTGYGGINISSDLVKVIFIIMKPSLFCKIINICCVGTFMSCTVQNYCSVFKLNLLIKLIIICSK